MGEKKKDSRRDNESNVTLVQAGNFLKLRNYHLFFNKSFYRSCIYGRKKKTSDKDAELVT